MDKSTHLQEINPCQKTTVDGILSLNSKRNNTLYVKMPDVMVLKILSVTDTFCGVSKSQKKSCPFTTSLHWFHDKKLMKTSQDDIEDPFRRQRKEEVLEIVNSPQISENITYPFGMFIDI
ncbi:hypothetical protein JTB14_007839 [Gonioctena quinquepunctata]|nr:hypothetical protein JTB14_007839 [Gonioctena quinquepunctata]